VCVWGGGTSAPVVPHASPGGRAAHSLARGPCLFSLATLHRKHNTTKQGVPVARGSGWQARRRGRPRQAGRRRRRRANASPGSRAARRSPPSAHRGRRPSCLRAQPPPPGRRGLSGAQPNLRRSTRARHAADLQREIMSAADGRGGSGGGTVAHGDLPAGRAAVAVPTGVARVPVAVPAWPAAAASSRRRPHVSVPRTTTLCIPWDYALALISIPGQQTGAGAGASGGAAAGRPRAGVVPVRADQAAERTLDAGVVEQRAEPRGLVACTAAAHPVRRGFKGLSVLSARPPAGSHPHDAAMRRVR
jgi:hypothetical protein